MVVFVFSVIFKVLFYFDVLNFHQRFLCYTHPAYLSSAVFDQLFNSCYILNFKDCILKFLLLSCYF